MPRWLQRVLLGLGALTLAAGGTVVIVGFAMWQTFRMTNINVTPVRSPDGRYVATQLYRDGPTYGYYEVTLEPRQGWHELANADEPAGDEVAEVAAEGLDGVEWKDNHTLVIRYQRFGDEAAEFVKKAARWRDVRLVYKPE